MKIRYYIILGVLLLICMPFLVRGCYLPISGTVIDAKTGEPIKNAVVNVKWYKTTGIGFVNTTLVRVDEVVTDKNGNFSLPGIFNPFINQPFIIIYKKQYVAWNNNYIFPSNQKRENFKWKSGGIYKLEWYKKGYSYYRHQTFMSYGVKSLASSNKLNHASSWEKSFAEREISLWRKKLNELRNKEKNYDQQKRHKELWEEVIYELYFSE